MIKLVIDRERWARGTGIGTLLAGHKNVNGIREGSMCCLGFLGLVCGIPRKQLLEEPDPLEAKSTKWLKGLFDGDTSSSAQNNLIMANDNEKITNDEREARITLHMGRIGVKVYFVDTKKEADALKRKLKKGKAK